MAIPSPSTTKMMALPKALGSSDTAPMAAGAAEATATPAPMAARPVTSAEAHALGIGADDGGNGSASGFSKGNARSGNGYCAEANQSKGAEVQGETVADGRLAGHLALGNAYQGSSDEKNSDSGNDQCENRHK